MHIGLVAAVLIASRPAVEAINCDKIIRRPQGQPASYLRASTAPSKTAFAEQEVRNVVYNKEIPPACEQALRILTFNIQAHLDLWGRAENTESIRLDLLQLQPTAAVFQEVILDDTHPQRKHFDMMLRSLGYVHLLVSRRFDREAVIGNMIASKLPLTRVADLDLGYRRTLVAAKLALPRAEDSRGRGGGGGGGHLLIMTAHLEVSSATVRLLQVARILHLIKEHIEPAHDRYILCGDFNAETATTEMRNLEKSAEMKESFRAAEVERPHCTFWDGRAVDYIFVSQGLLARVYGSYAYHTLSSDHLPLIADIGLAATCSQEETRRWIIALGLVWSMYAWVLPSAVALIVWKMVRRVKAQV